MTDKFELYDLLAVIVPGSLVIGGAIVLFPEIKHATHGVTFPEAFAVVLLVSLAVFVGQLVQAVASLTEPILDKSWGGRASERAFREGLGERYLSHIAARRVKDRLATALDEERSPRSLFLYAMTLAESAVGSRAPRFNALYAYHRALCSMVFVSWLLLLGSLKWGAAVTWPTTVQWSAAGGGLLLLWLIWFRTKQRAFYYVREVLLTAERVLQERKQPTPNHE